MLWAVWLASLLGSAHCAAMCGPLAAAAEAGGSPARRRIGYHAGRLGVYLALGGLAGWAGGALDRWGLGLGWSLPAARAAGLLLVAFGTLALLRALGVRIGSPRWLAAFGARLSAPLRALSPAWRALALGAASALLPCGWLYGFVAVAGATGSAGGGVLTMAVFWTGTVPAVASAGLVLQRLTGRLRRRLPAVTALALIVLGLLAAVGRNPSRHAGPGSAPVEHDGQHR